MNRLVATDHAPEHPAARGFADWTERRAVEYDAPELDGGRGLMSLWNHFLLEVEHGTHRDVLVMEDAS